MKNKHVWLIPVCLMVLMLVFTACSTPAAITQTPAISGVTKTTQAPTSNASTNTAPVVAEPQGELIAGVQDFGNENLLPWLATVGSSIECLLVYDMLIYWDHINFKFLPGLAESWDVSPDGMVLTYHLRKGIQFLEGWGELNSEDVKYNFEMQASKLSVGKAAQCRRIASMDTPDPYTLVVHFKDAYPTFWVDMSLGNSGICQGIVCKKYVETVGEEAASAKPIGTGPYKMVEHQLGSYYKFEAIDSHWRVVPEFKTLTTRLLPETSSLTAALKNKEIDLARVGVDQLADLKASGVAVEPSPSGGVIIPVRWGGMIVPEDKRYDPAYHNKDPWTDVRVRRAMTISIDREAICKVIFSGYAQPVGSPILNLNTFNYSYPYDPAAARQLIKDAGYPNGFSFNLISYKLGGIPQTPQIVEALAGYWQQIGLDPKITVIDYATYTSKNINPAKTAGDLSLWNTASAADVLSRVELNFMPNAMTPIYEDAGSYAIYRDNPHGTLEERNIVVDKLQQYFYDNFGAIPLVRIGNAYAWNSGKILPWPHHDNTAPGYWEYVRHAQPLNTFRLFTPLPGR